MNNYSFKRINKNSIIDLIPIFKNAFGIKTTYDILYEKINTFYTPISFLGYISYYNENIPCSYYAVYPVYAFINENKRLISQSGDTMTHGEHLGKGLFINSAELTYQLCIYQQVYGVFGFPSKSSYPGFKKKLGWMFNENINNYRFKVPTLPLAYLFSKSSFSKVLYNIWLNIILFFFHKGDIFEGSVRSNLQDGIVRDIDFWKYKMKKNENRLLKINNTNLVLKFNGRIGVGDLDIKSCSNLAPLIIKIKILAFFTFNSQINFFVSPNTLLDSKLSQISIPQKGLPIGYKDFSNEYSLKNLKFTYFDFDTF